MQSWFESPSCPTMLTQLVDRDRYYPSLATLFSSAKYRTRRKYGPGKSRSRVTSSSSPPCSLLPHHHHRHSIAFYLLLFCLLFLCCSSRCLCSYLPEETLGMSAKALALGGAAPAPAGNSVSAYCPAVCVCIWKSGKETATCDHRSLVSVPHGLATTTQMIDLSGNPLTHLPPNVFLDRGLVNLQRIFLVSAQLVEISAESFVKLSNLIELDLSNNTLSSVPSKSLAECAGLRRLSLSGNRVREVRSGAFLSLSRLQVLDLSHNAIAHLETDAFRGLRALLTLKLEANQLTTVPAAESFVQFLPSRLSLLELHDNRWRCDCHLKPLREWIVSNNIPLTVKPLCSAPARLQGLQWDSIQAHEFSCPPQIHAANTHFYKHIGNNVTITCPVTGFPQPAIFWLFESGVLEDDFDNRTEMAHRRGESIEDQSLDFAPFDQLLPSVRYSVSQDMENHILTSTLTVHSLQPHDTQRITCYARNVGGQVAKNFTLIVSTQEPFSSGRSMDFIVTEMFVIFVAIAILLLALLLFVTIFIARFKKRSSSHLVHSEQSRSEMVANGDGSFIKPTMNGDVNNGMHEKSIFPDGTTGGYLYQNGGVNGSTVPGGTNILMVSGIDMIAASTATGATINSAVQPYSSDPNSTNTDLSSQSTSATSMTTSGGGVSPNTLQTGSTSTTNNSTDSSGYYSTEPPIGPPDVTLLSEQNTNQPFLAYPPEAHHHHPYSTFSLQRAPANFHPPDLLQVTTSNYYIDPSVSHRVNICDYSQQSAFPLLNTGPLDPGANDLIYGTRIAPTRYGPNPPSKPKVKFSDQVSESPSPSEQEQLHRAAYTFGTLRKMPKEQRTNLKPISLSHRSVSSYPEGFDSLLMESSVDSGEPVQEDSSRSQKDSLDETEEDDYYRSLSASQPSS